MAIRHSITLSTTEPNNEIGVIKIRQADEQTQTLEVQITENGVPKSYQGLAVYFCAKLGQTAGLGIIEQKLKLEEMTNPTNGKLEYTMRAEDWQILGRQKGYFSFRKMKDEHEFVEQFTTRDFTFDVIKSVYSDGLKEVKKDGSTYVWTIEELIRLFKEYVESGKTDWEEFVEQNREVLESVDPGGKLIGEVIDARKPFGGEAYPTLGDRLDSDKAEVSRKLENFFNVRAFLCDDGEYVKGDGKHDDTTGIQNALDNAVGTLFFPRGIYKITKSLILNRNIDLIGFSRRDSVIRADGFTAEQDLLTVAITNNFGGLDVRGWSLKNLSLFLNAGGNWSLKILGGSTFEGAMQILSGEIDNISGSIYIKNNFAHGVIRRSGISRLYLECYDANVIEKNLFFGNDTAITIDIIMGVRNNVIRDNTIVNKNGAIKIINGDNIRIQNNQLEHMQGQGSNDVGYMILVEGKDRTVTNLVISENNFGGGSNVPNSILVDNAEDTIIEKNNFIATLENDIVITEKAKNTIIKPDNHSMPLGHIPRPNGIKILGEDYIGQPNNLSGENGWNDFKVIKETRYLVNVLEGLNGGLSEPESSISTLPIGLRTSVNETIPVLTSDGFGELRQGFNGKLFVKNIPSNKNVKVLPFHVDNSEHTNTKYTMYDDFNRVSFGTSNTGHVWETTHNNYQIIDGEVALIDIALEDFALITSNTVNPFMTLRLPKISTGHTKAIKLIFNYVDENNYCYLSVRDLSGYGFRFYKVVNGVEIEIGGYGNHSHIKDNMVITLEVKDSEVVLRTNGGYTISVVLEDKPRGFKHGFALSKTATNLVDDFAIKS